MSVKIADGTGVNPDIKGTSGGALLTANVLSRQQVSLNWEEMAGTAAVESALTNFTMGSRDAAALGAATNYQVSAGKVLKITSITVYLKATSTVTNLARFRIRQAGTVLNTSPVIFDTILVGSSVGAVTAGAGHELSISCDIEVVAGQQITFTWFTSANTCTVGMTITGYEY